MQSAAAGDPVREFSLALAGEVGGGREERKPNFYCCGSGVGQPPLAGGVQRAMMWAEKRNPWQVWLVEEEEEVGEGEASAYSSGGTLKLA